MKGHEIISHIIREEGERVREECHRRFASQEARPRNTVRLKRVFPVAAAIAMLFALSATAFASIGGFDRFIQRFNPSFAGVVEPVMAYSEDEGFRITVIGAQSFENMAIVYLSVQELTDENRLSQDMDWWPGLSIHVEGLSGGIRQSLLYFDDISKTAYLEISITANEEIPSPMTLAIDRFTLYPAKAVTGSWVMGAYVGDAAGQYIVAIAHMFNLYDVLAIERLVLTPLGLSMHGTFGAPGSDCWQSLFAPQRDVYVETPGGLIPLIASGVGVNYASPTPYGLEAAVNDTPRNVTIAKIIEWYDDIRVSIHWQSASPIDVGDVTAIVVDGIRIPVP
jgi:hypothetical protein